MARYVLRVFRDNVTGWVPTILVVAVVTTLVGICMNQFVWTSSPSFTLAARQAGLDPAEFGMVSVTIYVVVSLLAFFTARSRNGGLWAPARVRCLPACGCSWVWRACSVP